MNKFLKYKKREEANDGSGGNDGAGGNDGGDGGDNANANSGSDGSGADGGGNQGYFKTVPDDWRQQIAGEDEGRLNTLNRYTDLDGFINGSFEARDKIRSGETSSGLPTDPTEEQLSDYREANGIPAADAKYELSLAEGLELSETDSRMMENVLTVAHEGNIPNATMSAITSAWMQARDTEIERMQTQDGLDTQQSQSVLKEKWSGDFKENMDRANNQMNMLPESVREDIMSSRTGSGKALTSMPEFMQYLVDIDRGQNPMAYLPGGHDDQRGTAEQIIAKAQDRMKNDRKAWFKDTQANAEYQQALGAMQKYK